MMAAGRAAESGVSVLLLEKTEQPGKKILISGKNTLQPDQFPKNWMSSSRCTG